jgi:nicotinamide riboside transporter PnuC
MRRCDATVLVLSTVHGAVVGKGVKVYGWFSFKQKTSKRETIVKHFRLTTKRWTAGRSRERDAIAA